MEDYFWLSKINLTVQVYMHVYTKGIQKVRWLPACMEEQSVNIRDHVSFEKNVCHCIHISP